MSFCRVSSNIENGLMTNAYMSCQENQKRNLTKISRSKKKKEKNYPLQRQNKYVSIPKSKGIYLKERLLCRITENGSGEKVDAPVSSVYVLCRQVSGLSSGMT